MNMNRHERRAAKVRARLVAKNGGSHIVAVHEAGHAIAKVLAAEELGYSINEAIDRIEIGVGETLGRSVDGRMITRSQAVTYGPTFSRDIDEASFEFKQTYLSGRAGDVTLEGREQLEYSSKLVELGRAAGANIGKWFRARVFDAVSGSMAEAIFSKRAFYDVWHGYEAESDEFNVVRDAVWAGIGTDEIKATIRRMAVLSFCVMERPEVWAAVLALANKVPAVGTMKGVEAVAIIAGVIPAGSLTGIFREASERVAELEREITAAKVVLMETPDGSNEPIKGKELIQKLKDAGIDSVEAVRYQSASSVFGEVLFHAFGDGAVSREDAKAA
jgi:hypothetical protein